MKQVKLYRSWLLLPVFVLLIAGTDCFAQEDTAEPIVKLYYYNNNNAVQYLILESQLKKNKIFTPQANKLYNIYLDSSNESNLVAKLKTDETGRAKTFIGNSLKPAWDAASSHSFIVKEGDKEIISDFIINKSRITLDTANIDGVRSITASVSKLEGSEWVPVPDVELKIGIERMGSILSAGDDETYTTDSTGSISVDLAKTELPGDAKGNYVIAARADDNEFLGNLLIEKTVPWGKATVATAGFFDQRTLWSTRFRTPYWLLFMAYSIVIGVWSSLIYLVIQIIKIKKLGGESPRSQNAALPEMIPEPGS
jgi:hypothetical protein